MSTPESRYTIETGRPYIHKKCGGGTCVQGDDFVELCNPFQYVRGTMCAACGTPDQTDQFHWEDTEELLSDYRQRLLRKSPLLSLWTRFSPLLVAAIGAGFVFLGPGKGKQNPFIPLLIFSGVSALVMWTQINPLIVSTLKGNKFYENE
jgi:hypothetical protein